MRIYSISHNERSADVMLPPRLHPDLGLAILHHHVQWGGQQLPGSEASEAGPGQTREQIPAGLRLQHHHRRPRGHLAQSLGKYHSHVHGFNNIRRGELDHRVKTVEYLFHIIVHFSRIYVVNPPPPSATKVSCSWNKPDGNKVLRNFVICTKDSDTKCFICQPGAIDCCK